MVPYHIRNRTTNCNTNTVSNIGDTSNKIMKIKIRNNNIESALSILRRRSKEIIFEYKEKQYFEKGSSKRHKAKQAAKPGRTSGRKGKLLKKEVRKYNGV